MTPPKAGRPWPSAIPGARTEVIAGAGHMMMGEAPEATLRLLRTVLPDR